MSSLPRSTKLTPITFSLFCALTLNGCGSDTKNPDTVASEVVSKGAFVGSHVEGLKYSTATQQGYTTENGLFDFMEGELITFSVGVIEFPSITAKSILTPLDLSDAIDSGTLENTEAINITRFLQSLDADQNLENGIQISVETHTTLTQEDYASFGFDSDASEFETEAEEILEKLPLSAELVSEEEAVTHLQTAIDEFNEDNAESYIIRSAYKSNIEDLSDQALKEDSGSILIILEDPETDTGTTAVYSIKSLDEAIFPSNQVLLETDENGTKLSLTPAANSFGSGRFILTEMNGPVVRTRVFKINVEPVNDSPSANNRSIQTTLNTQLNDNLLDFVTDVDNDSLNFSKLTGPVHGQLSLASDGSFSYIPQPGFSGEDSFTYEVSDQEETSNTATVTIYISGVQDIEEANDAPIAMTSTFSMNEDGILSDTLEALDAEDSTVSFQLRRDGEKGTVELNESSGVFTYTPRPDEYGEDSFTFIANDGELDSEIATVYVLIASDNDAPYISPIPNQTIIAGESLESIAFAVSDNETDANDLAVSFLSSSSLVINSEQIYLSGEGLNRALTINTEQGKLGEVEITLRVSDGELSSETSFFVTITSNNTPPSVEENLSFSTEIDTSLEVSLAEFATDIDGDNIRFELNDQEGPGTFTLSPEGLLNFTPDSETLGDATLFFTVSDNEATRNASLTVSITATPIVDRDNDGIPDASDNCPTVSNSDQADTNENGYGDACDIKAYADSLRLDEDTSSSITVLTNDSSIGGGSINVTAASANNGRVDISSYPITYSPNSNFNGRDTISYTIEDELGRVASSTVYVRVNSINDHPVAVNESLTTNENTNSGLYISDLLSNDYDIDGGTLSLVSVGAEIGTAFINDGVYLDYRPASNYSGSDTITYVIQDGQGGSATGIVNVTIIPDEEPLNSPPVTEALSLEVTANSDYSGSITRAVTDADEDPLTFEFSDSTSGGESLITSEGILYFSPNPDFTGTVHINYRVSDGQAQVSGEITITVIPEVVDADTDEDGYPDTVDNCPNIANPDQLDSDEDGVGNACEIVGGIAFADPNMAACVAEQYPSATLVNNVTRLECNARNISSTSGLEELSALNYLSIYDNNLSMINVSNNPALYYLNLTSNNLSSIDVSRNTALTSLYIDYNDLSTLDISSNTRLNVLDVYNNNLSELDVSVNSLLSRLRAGYNDFSTFDVSNNTNLRNLDLSQNSLSVIDVSSNTALRELNVAYNQLSNIDVSSNIELTHLTVYNDNLASIDLSRNTELIWLGVSSNLMSSIDISNNTRLESLSIFANNISTLDLSNNTALSNLTVRCDSLLDLDVSRLSALTFFTLASNSLEGVDVSSNRALRTLSVIGSNLPTLNVLNNTALTTLYIDRLNLSSLNISNNTALSSLTVYSSNLPSLDVSNNTELTSIDVKYNNLSTINVDANPSLTRLDLRSNPLDSATISYLDSLVGTINNLYY